MSQLFASGGLNVGASASVLPVNILGLVGRQDVQTEIPGGREACWASVGHFR